jgi:hypothetical protein
VRRDWDPEDMIAYWTLLDSDWQLVANKSGATWQPGIVDVPLTAPRRAC